MRNPFFEPDTGSAGWWDSRGADCDRRWRGGHSRPTAGHNPHLSRSVDLDDLAALRRGHVGEVGVVYVVAEEPDRPVAEDEVRPVGVLAAELPGVLQVLAV